MKEKQQDNNVWTRFYDMSSGGDQKENWGEIYIQAPQNEAEHVFYHKFGHNPNRVSCTCCGNDYSINEQNETPEQKDGVLIIKSEQIQDFERVGELPEQGYVWVG